MLTDDGAGSSSRSARHLLESARSNSSCANKPLPVARCGASPAVQMLCSSTANSRSPVRTAPEPAANADLELVHLRRTGSLHPASTLIVMSMPGSVSPRHRRDVNVLRPGEATVPLRRNSNQLEICIRGSGTCSPATRVRGRRTRHLERARDAAYTYRATGRRLGRAMSIRTRRCSKNSARTTSRKNPAAGRVDVEEAQETHAGAAMRARTRPTSASSPKARGCAATSTSSTSRSRVEALLGRGKPCARISRSAEPDARGILLLYNPATERRNGTTHSFFATLGGGRRTRRETGAARPSSHSVAVNYRFGSAAATVSSTARPTISARQLADARRAELDRSLAFLSPFARRHRLADGPGPSAAHRDGVARLARGPHPTPSHPGFASPASRVRRSARPRR